MKETEEGGGDRRASDGIKYQQYGKEGTKISKRFNREKPFALFCILLFIIKSRLLIESLLSFPLRKVAFFNPVSERHRWKALIGKHWPPKKGALGHLRSYTKGMEEEEKREAKKEEKVYS